MDELSLSPEREPFAPPRARKTGIWTDSAPSSKEINRSPSPGLLSRNDSEDDIPLIPEIQEIQEEDFLGDISEAPVVPMNTVTSFSQLNSDLKKYAAFSIVDNVNLGLLTKHLYNESDLKEGDKGWSWDLLFTEVSSDLRSDWEQKNSEMESK